MASFSASGPVREKSAVWGDPEFAAAYGEAGFFLGSKGIELFNRCPSNRAKCLKQIRSRSYKDPTLRYPETEEWKKYKYSYRLWGRLLLSSKGRSCNQWQRY